MKVPMMRLEKRYLTSFDLRHGTGVVLPFEGATEMVLLLPQRGLSPDALWSEVDLLAKLDDYDPEAPLVTLGLPRFEFASQTLDLSKAWAALGLANVLKVRTSNRCWTPSFRAISK